MAVWNQFALSDAMTAGRFDAEFFRPDFMEFEEAARRHDALPLGKIADTIRRGVQPQYDEEGSIPVIRTVNVRELELSSARQEFVNEEFAHANQRGIVKSGDILVTSTGVGTLGRVGYQHEDTTYFADSHITYIRNIRGIHPLYVTAFLQSRVGNALIEKRQRGSSGQIEIYPFDLATIPIPRLADIEYRVVGLYESALATVKRASAAYMEAEALLESVLGLNKLDPTPRLFYERSYADIQTATRFDAEYFQPRMQNLIAALSRDGQTIGDIAKLSKRRFNPTPGKQFDYIEIGDISGSGTANSTPVTGEDAPSRATWIVNPGDIITTTVRPIRRLSAIISNEQAGYVCSSGFAVLTPQSPNKIAAELLLVYLRLPLICELLNLHTTSSMYPAIATTDLMKIPITLPDNTIQGKIISKVRDSFDAQHEAKRLIDETKAMIETTLR